MKSLIILFFLSFGQLAIANQKPNILVVLLDDAGFMDFGIYGSDSLTPSINNIGERGAIFSRYYTSPSCGPSRAMLLTGQSNHAVGMGALVETITPEMAQTPAYSMIWKADQKTLASRLKAAGYQTFITGKWGIGASGKNLPHRFGFDRSFVMDATGGNNYDERTYLPSKAHADWFEDGKPIKLPKDFYSSESLVDKMIGYIDQADSTRPFLAYVSMQALHIPVQVPKKWIDKYDGVFDRGWDVMREERLEKAIARGLVPKGTKLAPSPAHHRKWDSLSEREKAFAAKVMQTNAGMMEAADFHTGRLIENLRAKGLLDNTLIFVTSDNGAESAVMSEAPGFQGAFVRTWMAYEGYNAKIEHLGEASSLISIGPEWASVSSAPFKHYKFNGTEGGLRVPLVVAGPNIKQAGVQNGRVHVTDLTPTILDATGVSYDEGEFAGRSIMPILRGQKETVYKDNEAVGFEVQGTGAIYRGDWKITRVPPPLGDGQWHLYNVAQDPGETNDLSQKNPMLFQELLNEYQRYAKQVGIFDTPMSESAAKQLGKNQILKSAKRFWPVTMVGALLFLSIIIGPLVFVSKKRSKIKTIQNSNSKKGDLK